MKKFFLLAVAVCALAGLSVAGVASAANGAETTQFKAAYQFSGSAYATCSGVNVYKTAPKLMNQDSETCQLSGDDGIFPVGTSVWGAGIWISDSQKPSHSAGLIANSLTVTKTLNADGVTYTLDIVANY